MTVEEICAELRELSKQWKHQPMRYGGDDEYLDGREDGREYCAEDIDALVRKAEGK